jgi:hypothetical protein
VFWPIARRYRGSMHETPKFRVRSLPHPSFADQSANDASANVPNVSQVTSVFWPTARGCRSLGPTTPKFRVRSFPHRSFADQSADDSFAYIPLHFFHLFVQPLVLYPFVLFLCICFSMHDFNPSLY